MDLQGLTGVHARTRCAHAYMQAGDGDGSEALSAAAQAAQLDELSMLLAETPYVKLKARERAAQQMGQVRLEVGGSRPPELLAGSLDQEGRRLCAHHAHL